LTLEKNFVIISKTCPKVLIRKSKIKKKTRSILPYIEIKKLIITSKIRILLDNSSKLNNDLWIGILLFCSIVSVKHGLG